MQQYNNTIQKKNDVLGEKIRKKIPSWPQILDSSCRILIIGSSGSERTNALLNTANHMLQIHAKRDTDF